MTLILDLLYFAVLNISYSLYNTGILITISTNNPCHLTCYYTDKEPLKHATARTIRGITLPWGNYFCFVAWKTVEQTEPGDTLIHTFNLTDWLGCQTRWFTFRGTVEEQLSPSAGPIFEKHKPYFSQVTPQKDTHIIQYYPNTNYGTMPIFSIRDLNNEAIRTIISFDLTSIPAGAKLLSATLALYYYNQVFAYPVGKLVRIYECTRPQWIETEATWNIYKTGYPWTTPGGDYALLDPPPASFTIPYTFGWIETNVIALVTHAIANSLNAHFLIKFNNETQTPLTFSVINFRSREYLTDPALRPKLTVFYEK